MTYREEAAALLQDARSIGTELTTLRRTIHMHPELGMEEFETQRLVLNYLGELGVEARPVAKTGVLGILRGTAPGADQGPVIACRADMDALPMQEANEHEYKSRIDGKMHSCGHDAHTAMLLGTVKLLAGRRERLPGTVKFFFQPAEEGPGGAEPMIEEGVMQDPQVQAVIGAHVQSGLETGTIGVTDGYSSASADAVRIKIIGRGGHGAHPHGSIDAITVAAHVITALQTIVSRETNPLDSVVITVGTIHGGFRANIIAPEVELTATVRSMKEQTREELPDRIERIVAGVCQSMNAKYEFEYHFGYGPLYNDARVVKLVSEAAADIVGEDNLVSVEPSMGAEDFSYFAREAPGAFFRVGVRNEAKDTIYPGHHPKFDIDEDALPIGTAVMAYSAFRFLHEGLHE